MSVRDNKPFYLKFWGVRGSIPSPISPADVRAKVRDIARLAVGAKLEVSQVDDWLATLPFQDVSTFGGNTSCVEIRAGSRTIILDMGSGLRGLGASMMPDIMTRKSMRATAFISHVHWDHIQGFPFFAPLYLPNTIYDCELKLFGGVNWQAPLETVLRGQMDPPVFPVDLERIALETMQMKFGSVHDRFSTVINDDGENILVTTRRLNHPQETYGYRVEYQGKVIAFTTDNEGYPFPDPALVELAKGADIWVQDVQYTTGQYRGHEGVARLGWGHAEPIYVSEVAREAKPKKIVTTHHDPAASDTHVMMIAKQVAELSGIETVPAYEGLRIDL